MTSASRRTRRSTIALARHALVAIAFTAAIPSATRGQEAERPLPPAIKPTVYAATGSDSMPYDSVRTGMLLRMSAGGILHRRMGVIEARFADTLLFRGVTERELVRVSRDEIEWAQVSTGRRVSRGNLVKGAVIGVLAGAAIASFLQHSGDRYDSARDPCPLPIGDLDCGMSPRYLFTGIAIGMTGGMLIAARYPADRWRNILIR